MAEHGTTRFEQVILPHLDDAYTLARYLLRDQHDAQDAVQESVLRALRYFEGFRGEDARAWLLTIVRNYCFTWKKGRRVDRSTMPFTDDETIEIADYPQLKLLCWNRPGRFVMAREAWEIYERNWRFVERDQLEAKEQELIRTLVTRFGAGVMNV